MDVSAASIAYAAQMRPLEGLVLLAFVPLLAQPLLAERWRQGRTAWIVGLLPALFSLLHALLEGWRTQMIPLYLLALAALAVQVSATRQRPRKRMFILFGVLLAACALLPAWVLPVFHLPRPTGPYLVGVTERVVKTEPGRRLMTTVWYPATAKSAPAPLTHEPAQVAAGLGQAFGLPSASLFLQHLKYLTVNASTDVPAVKKAFPVLVFSPGLTGLRLQNSETFQELASHGFIIVALDHTDAAAVTVFPDGEVHPFNLARFGIRPNQIENSTRLLLPYWMADQKAIYDVLAKWNQSDPLLRQHFDLGKIASFGHSFGGVTSVEVCRVEPRCQAAANLDGGWASSMPPHGSPKPTLLISAQASAALPVAMKHWQQLMERSSDPAVWLELPNSNHLSFTLTPRLSPLLSPREFRPDAAQQTVNRTLLAFFDMAFKHQPERFLNDLKGQSGVRIRFPRP